MDSHIFATAAAITPIFLSILLGWAIRKLDIMPAGAWAGVNRLAFYVLAPMYLLHLITHADISGAGAGHFILVLMTGVVISALAALVIKPLLTRNSSFASVFQAAVRWNAIVLLAAAPSMFGADGASLLALALAPMTVACNVLAVAGFSLWGGTSTLTAKGLLKGFLFNPLLLGSFGGGVLLLINFRIPEPLSTVVLLCGQASIPLILLCVGAGLNFGAVLNAPRYLLAGLMLRLAGGPLAMLLATEIWGLSGLAKAVAIAAGATPTAAAGYVLAREMGGDAELMAGLVTATTLLSAITIPLAVSLLAH
ncbi:MAG: AEC family transporter [Caulobacterales bacterium]